jgi:hypothetical protein
MRRFVSIFILSASQLLDLLEAHILRPRPPGLADPYNNPAIVGTYSRLLYAAPYSYEPLGCVSFRADKLKVRGWRVM